MRLKEVDTDLMILWTTIHGKLIKRIGSLEHRINSLESDIQEMKGTQVQMARDLELSLMMQMRLFTTLLPRESLLVLPSLTFAGVTSSMPVPPTSASEPPFVSMTKPRDPIHEMESREEHVESEFDKDDDGYSE
ncbi:unnamed protein product [Ilex paraguariensis]|uniref:Uncharacterized protein n=1 Tax=Ilex paraguariensis TaxID=185542 RepID=A0ABC8T4G5_9AQUA